MRLVIINERVYKTIFLSQAKDSYLLMMGDCAVDTFILPPIPIIQAPMAGGITTPSLVKAVADTGAVGSFGFAYSTADKIAADMTETRHATTGLINANFFIIEEPQIPDEEDIKAAITALSALPFTPDPAYTAPKPPFTSSLTAQLEPIWQCPPDYLTFHFGIPDEEIIKRAKSAGILIGMGATSITEAKAVAKAGADFIIAQGYEAGGHRGTFTAEAIDDEQLGTLALTKLIAHHIHLPVVSAGAIMTARDIKEAQKAGASLVQMGTAFLCADEAGTAPSYRAALLAKSGTTTCITRHFSGRQARSLQNEFITQMNDKPYLPFPVQNTLTASLRSAASKAGKADYQSLWAGTGYQAISSAPAKAIITNLMKDL